MMRLARALAGAGICSRRDAEDRIRAGRVSVNGVVVTNVATNVDALHDCIEHDGERTYLERPRTIVMYKPEDVITTVEDTHGRKTVRDLLPNVKERVYPVGRLDADASGVLLLTNDGDLAYRLTHPKYQVKKTYRVWVEGKPQDRDLRRVARGISLDKDGNHTAPAHVTLVRGIKGGSILRITVHEGRKHEIKRLCERIGHPCTRLVREKFAGIGLSGLSPGQSRDLDFKEVSRLHKLTKLEADTRRALRESTPTLNATTSGALTLGASAPDAPPPEAAPPDGTTPAVIEQVETPTPMPPPQPERFDRGSVQRDDRPGYADGKRGRPDDTGGGRSDTKRADTRRRRDHPHQYRVVPQWPDDEPEETGEAETPTTIGPAPLAFDARRARIDAAAARAEEAKPESLPKAKRRKRKKSGS